MKKYPITREEAKDWCTAIALANPKFGERLLEMSQGLLKNARESKDSTYIKNAESMQQHLVGLDSKKIATNSYDLCRYAATGKWLASGETISREPSLAEKQQFYELWSTFPALVQTLYSTWRDLQGMGLDNPDLQRALRAILFEAALYAGASQAWHKKLEDNPPGVPRDLYASMGRKIGRMQSALRDLDEILSKQKSAIDSIRTVAPTSVKFQESSPLFSMVQSLADEMNQLGLKSMQSQRYSKR